MARRHVLHDAHERIDILHSTAWVDDAGAQGNASIDHGAGEKWSIQRSGRPRVDHRPWADICYLSAIFKIGNHFGFRFKEAQAFVEKVRVVVLVE